jgi:uncharacterized protein (UPF0261 family)
VQSLIPRLCRGMSDSAITCIRTEQKEMRALARHIAGMCNKRSGPLDIVIPMQGFSAFDRPGGPLHDPEAPAIFTEELKKGLNPEISLYVLPYHINDPEFASEIVRVYESRIAGKT